MKTKVSKLKAPTESTPHAVRALRHESEEDAIGRLKADRMASRAAGGFFHAHEDEFLQLVATYSDEDARLLLEVIRGRFWSVPR
jgi:hypothetical protein